MRDFMEVPTCCFPAESLVWQPPYGPGRLRYVSRENTEYNYRAKGALIFGIVLTTVMVFFVGSFFYGAATGGRMSMNGRPASDIERWLTAFAVLAMGSPFWYIGIQSILRQCHEKIVFQNGEVIWTDSLNRERIRCLESDITGTNTKNLYVNGMVRRQVLTHRGPINYNDGLNRRSEFEARIGSILKGEKPATQSQSNLAVADRRWQGKSIYTYRSWLNLFVSTVPPIFVFIMSVAAGGGAALLAPILLFVAPILYFFGLSYLNERIEFTDWEIIVYNRLGKVKLRAPHSDIRSVDEINDEASLGRIYVGDTEFRVSSYMKDYQAFIDEMKRFTSRAP